MKAYQVFKGEKDVHGRQQYDLISTYLDRERALAHCKQIAESRLVDSDVFTLEEYFYGKGKFKNWVAIGWERVIIAQFQEIDIIE